MKIIIGFILVLGASMWCMMPCLAETVIYQAQVSPSTLYQVKDSYMRSDLPDKSGQAEGAGVLFIGTETTRTFRSLISFDVNIPFGQKIDSATFELNVYQADDANQIRNIACYQVLQQWKETEATWNRVNSAKFWNTAGCDAASDSGELNGLYDRKATPVAITQVSDGNMWYSWDVVSAVSDWYQNGTDSYGLVFIDTNAPADKTLKRIRSSDNAYVYLHPKLTITYSPSGNYADCNEVGQSGALLTADLNGDCYVNMKDLSEIVTNWLQCNDPNTSNCVM